jgi:glycogen synthase
MLAQSPVAGDSRVIREAATLAAAGNPVHIVGRDVPAGFQAPPGVTVESVGRARGLKPAMEPRRDSLPIQAARWLFLPEHRARVQQAWARSAERLLATHPPADVVHAHDFNTLELAAALASRWNARLVYDAHELWSGRPRIGRPTPIRTAQEQRLEKKLGRQAAAVLTVGEGIADALRDAYGWSHVHVVRNTFEPRLEPIGARVGPAGAVYAGRLAPYRELEVIAAASQRLDLPITLVGPADRTWLGGFDPGAAMVQPPTSLDGVDHLLSEAGLALVTHSDRWPNHRLALPNKLFHAVRVGVPVVATDVGELAKAVREHGLGLLYRPGDHGDLVRAVRSAIVEYPALRAAVAEAVQALTWPRDQAALLDVYSGLHM